MTIPVLTYGSELWTMTRNDERSIQRSEMKFLRKTKGCTLRDQIRNEDISIDLNVYSMGRRIREGQIKQPQLLLIT